LQAQDSVYDRFVSLASARFKAGEAGNLELINAERIRNENRIEMEKAEKSYRSAMLAFRQLLNTDTVVVPADVSLPVIRQEMPEASVSFEQTPLGGMYAARITASERNLSLAKQGYMPGLSIGLTGQLLIKGFNPYDIERSRFDKGNFMGFEVGVSIPLFWGGQNAKVKAARRDVELAEISRRQAKQRMDKEYRDGLNELFRAQKVLDYYTAQGNGQGERMGRLSQVSYENGEIGYVEYIQNQQTALDVQLRYADAVNDYNQAIIMLNYIKGNK
jgi:outer membrane efflux protein